MVQLLPPGLFLHTSLTGEVDDSDPAGLNANYGPMLMPSEDGYKWRGTVKRNSVIGEIFAQVEKKESSKVVTRQDVKKQKQKRR